MPVNKRAARPPILPSSDEPRSPQTSENDFTVLFERVSARMFKPPPAKHTVPAKPSTSVPPPMRARPSPTEPEGRGGRERPTPLVMAMPPANDEVVTVPPSIRVHLIRITVLLTFGCFLGVGVEVLARGQVASSAPPDEGSHVSTAAAQPSSLGDDDSSRAGPVGVGVGERVTLARAHHHHHRHHGAPASPPASAAPPARASHEGVGVTAAQVATNDDDDDTDVDGGDDLSAAMKTLTKAKEELTIP